MWVDNIKSHSDHVVFDRINERNVEIGSNFNRDEDVNERENDLINLL